MIGGADVFLGLSAPNVLKPEMVQAMADRPLVLALANPDPEILPEDARAARPDCIIATGRSDYPNQVNNVLCFPFIFRGALDVGATAINEAMKIACVHALADLARQESSDIVAQAYGGESAGFGPDYLIPRPFDPRLIVELAPAVARAAMDSGVATRAIDDFDAYEQRLSQFVFRSGLLMKPIFQQARQDRRRLVYAEGEDERVLRAAQMVVDERIGEPILIGRPDVVATRVAKLGLRFRPGEDCELVNPEDDPRYREYWTLYHEIMERKGVSPDAARTIVRASSTVIAATMLRRGEADAMICGTVGRYADHLRHVTDIIGVREGVHALSAVSVLILPKGTFFLADAYVTADPDAEEIFEMTLLAAAEVRRFGVEPKVALLSHSSFGSRDTSSGAKMRAALRLLHARAPDLETEGEMHADAAIDETIRHRVFPNSRLTGQANLLIMPTLDAANIAFNLLKVLGDGLAIGPILIGAARPAHVLTTSVSARGILNMSAYAAVCAQTDAAGTAPPGTAR